MKRRGIRWWTRARRRLFKKAWRAFAKHRARGVRAGKTRAAKVVVEQITEDRGRQAPAVLPPQFPGQLVGKLFAQPEAVVEPFEPEEWDVTTHYPPEDGPVLDFSIRMVAKERGQWKEQQVRGAFWYALLHGASKLKAWKVTGFDWYKGGKLYSYDEDRVDEVMGAAGGVFKTVGIGGLRVAPVDKTGDAEREE